MVKRKTTEINSFIFWIEQSGFYLRLFNYFHSLEILGMLPLTGNRFDFCIIHSIQYTGCLENSLVVNKVLFDIGNRQNPISEFFSFFLNEFLLSISLGYLEPTVCFSLVYSLKIIQTPDQLT